MTFTVKSPILGFEQIQEVELNTIDEFFIQFISKSDSTTFTLINPFLLREYDFEVPEYFRELLDIKENSNILVLNAMIVSTKIEQSTINFLAPFIFNCDNQSMCQIVLDANKYPKFGLVESISSYLNQ